MDLRVNSHQDFQRIIETRVKRKLLASVTELVRVFAISGERCVWGSGVSVEGARVLKQASGPP